MRTARTEIAAAVLLCLLGAFVVLVSAGNDWVGLRVSSTLLGERTVGVEGGDVASGLRALGLVGLAGVVAIAATRRLGRVLVGVLLLLVGAAAVALVVDVLRDPFAAAQGTTAVREAGGAASESFDLTPWPYACALGGVLLAAAGLLVAGRGRRWAALSQRYEAPAAREAAPAEGPRRERELWEALDRGEDPTRRPS